MALARCILMSQPECPPLQPRSETRKAMSPASVSTGSNWKVAVPSTPPAHPTYSSPSVSESRLISVFPCRNPPSSANAPYIPVSSSTVKSASNGGCTTFLSAKIAIAVATPIPLSAPSVVPLAVTHSPFSSMYASMGSFSKSKTLSLFFCGTISMWPCRITPGWFSNPAEAGLRMSTLPISSVSVSNPKLRP